MFKSIPLTLAAAGVVLISACAPHPSAQAAPAASFSEAEVLSALVTARGAFRGESKHVTTGHASIARIGKAQWVVILEDDFTFDGAPDPHVALGSNGYRKDASLALLSSNNGKQVYAIPAGLDVAQFNEVWIWCDKFSVPLGSAALALK